MNGYDIAYWLAGLVASPFWVVKPSARRKVMGALAQRMGRDVPVRQGKGAAVWIHAVSMGEINATRALVKGLQESRPGVEVIVSTTTATGYERGKQLYGDVPGVMLIRFPLDLTPAVVRTLERVRPDVVVLMELEVWPNFMRQCRKRGIPVMVINARLTPHSLKRYRWIAPVTRAMFSQLAAVGAQEKGYAEQFVLLGVEADRVRVTGTMKFDTAEVGETVAWAGKLAEEVGIRVGERVWVCGSTGPGEEKMVLEGYRELLKEFPELRLVIVPRHPDRFDEVAKLIEREGYSFVRRSDPGHVRNPDAAILSAPVVLGDTMGELRKFYALATVVFVGRTLVDLGPRQRGSDMIEPAALGRPTIVGKWTQNFSEVMNAFRGAGGVYEVADRADLTRTVGEILSNPEAATEKGRRAREAVERNKGATGRHVEMILERLPKTE